MVNLFKRKPDKEKVKPYQTEEEIDYALDTIIECCNLIITRVDGMTRDQFLSDDDKMKASAIDMLVIGNFAGRLPDEIKSMSKHLKDAYGFRCRVAHDYGTIRFESEYLWIAVSKDVHGILKTCTSAKKKLANGEIRFLK